MRTLVLVAGAIFSLSLGGALLVLLPAAVLTTAVYVNLALFSLSVFSLFVAPSSDRKNPSDASAIASLGPQYVSGGLLILCAVAALWAAIHGLTTVAYALDVLGCGSFVSAQALIRATRKKIDLVASNDHGRGQTLMLVNRLTDLRDRTVDESLRQTIDKIADKVRYGPTPAREVTRSIDAELDVLLSRFAAETDDASVIHASLRQLDDVIGRRARMLQDFRRQS